MLITFIKKQRDLFRQWRRELSYKFQYESPVRISPKTKLSKQSFIGRYSYMGIGIVFDDIHVGRYCSIADGFTIVSGNHALNYLTTHPIYASNALFGWIDEYRDIDFKTKKMDPHHAILPSPLIIGHDVWMGNRVTLLGKVKSIGNGAVIGAGSVVTKDVPPYAIVAGNPAKILRYRFPDLIIKELEKLKWWDLPLSAIKHLNLADIESCIAELKKIRATHDD
jgi:acetyltransferase-like isoleucine patch superfamily enzyme